MKDTLEEVRNKVTGLDKEYKDEIISLIAQGQLPKSFQIEHVIGGFNGQVMIDEQYFNKLPKGLQNRIMITVKSFIP